MTEDKFHLLKRHVCSDGLSDVVVQEIADKCELVNGLERIVHQLRGIRIGVALGGGAARGMGHLGVLKVLVNRRPCKQEQTDVLFCCYLRDIELDLALFFRNEFKLVIRTVSNHPGAKS